MTRNFIRGSRCEHPDDAGSVDASERSGAEEIAVAINYHIALRVGPIRTVAKVMQRGVLPSPARKCQLENRTPVILASARAGSIEIGGLVHRERGVVERPKRPTKTDFLSGKSVQLVTGPASGRRYGCGFSVSVKCEFSIDAGILCASDSALTMPSLALVRDDG